MPSAGFIPGPGDSAEANNPLTQVGILQRILNEHTEAQQRAQLVQANLRTEDLRAQQLSLENQKQDILNQFIKPEAEGALKLQGAQTQGALQQVLTEKAQQGYYGMKNLETALTMWDTVTTGHTQAQKAQLERDIAQKNKDDLDEADVYLKKNLPSMMRDMKNEDGTPMFDPKMVSFSAPLAAIQALMGLKEKQAQTQEIQGHADYFSKIAQVKGAINNAAQDRIIDARLRTYASLAPEQAAGMLAALPPESSSIERAFLKARAIDPGVKTPEQLLLRVAQNPDDPEASQAAAQLLLEMKNVNGEKIPAHIEGDKIVPEMIDKSKNQGLITKVLGSMFAGKKKAAPTTQSSKVVSVSSPAEAAKLSPGTRYSTPDGRIFTR
jgi:hypothetical protein